MKPKSGVKIFYDEGGNKTGVLMTVRYFENLIEELEDLHDILTVYERTSKPFTPIPYEKIQKELFGDGDDDNTKRKYIGIIDHDKK
jgi:hypothetical protein